MLSRVQYTHAIQIFAFRKIKRGPKLNLNEHGKVDWSQFFRLIPLTNFTDRGIFASRTDGSEKSRVSKSCSCWDRGRQLHYDRLFSNFLHGIATLSQFGWGVLPGWMIHVLGCCRVVSCSQGVQGSPAKEGFRFLFRILCIFRLCISYFLYFPHLAWWSPYMLVGGISMPLGHPSYWKHKFTLIQNNF